MAQTIYKYPLNLPNGTDGYTDVQLPTHWRVVHIGIQYGVICLWVQHAHDARPTKSVKFRLVGTGHQFEDTAAYLGTVYSGPFVWHVLEV